MIRFALAACAALLSTAALAQDTIHLRPYNETPKSRSGSDRSSITPMATAPRLTSVAVFAVGSSQYGDWEYTYGKYSTPNDHGGSQLRVAVEEWGYAGWRSATYNGTTLPSSANYADEPICGGTPANPTGCSSGQTVIGWIRYWNLDGLGNSGNFQYQASSVNGGGSYSTSIYIK